MGCRTRVLGNVYDPDRPISNSRGNLSFTTINLVRCAIVAGAGNLDKFFQILQTMLDATMRELLERFEVQKQRLVRKFPFLMGEGVWLDSDTLERR